MVTCMECGAEFKNRIQWTHFKKCPGSVKSLAEYKEKYPTAELVSEWARKACVMTRDKMIEKYGLEEGEIRWERYRELQRKTNTFEYKNEKYGMTRQEFEDYNKMRSTTLDNMISRHGIEEGTRKWDQYRDRQRETCSRDYFIKTYGSDDGAAKYDAFAKGRARGIDWYMEKYGADGESMYIQSMEDLGARFKLYSKVSQEFCVDVERILEERGLFHTYYATKNKEFGSMDGPTKKYYFYDFVNIDLMLCIEFNGDLYHGNPAMYDGSDIPPFINNTKTANELWEKDRIKNHVLEKRGFLVVTVWERDYYDRKEIVLNNIKEVVNERIEFCKQLCD